MNRRSPANLSELDAMPPGVERVTAAGEYIAARERAIAEARALRNADIRALVAQLGVAETARRTGMSASNVKVIRGAR